MKSYGESTYLKKVVVMKERRVVLQLALMGLVHLVLPLLLQFRNTLAATVETLSKAAPGFIIVRSAWPTFTINLTLFRSSLLNLPPFTFKTFSPLQVASVARKRAFVGLLHSSPFLPD